MSMLKPALPNLRELVDKVLALAGAGGEKIKSVLEGITGKLKALTA
jgi:hypothetical protein